MIHRRWADKTSVIPMSVIRFSLMTAALLPYVYYGVRDNIYHFVGRRVSIPEHLLHVVIGCVLIVAIAHGYRGNAVRF